MISTTQQEYHMMLPPPHRTKLARLPFGLFVILLVSTAQPATPCARKSAAASLEDAVVQAPADPTKWLALAKFHDGRAEVAPAALSYVRASTLSLDSDSAKHAAARLWKFLIPKPGESSAGIGLKLTDKASLVWAPTELVLSMTRFAKDFAQREAALRPVLRAADFAGLDLERAFATVAAVAAALTRFT